MESSFDDCILLTMSLKQEWPIALRLVWLTGGLVAVNEPGEPDVLIKSNVMGCTFVTFGINTYPSLFSVLKSLGFLIIGTTFVTDGKQLEGFRAPEFRAAGAIGGWPVSDARQQWRQIVFASSRNQELRLMDAASRISAGLRYSEMRLCDLAMSYSVQLHSRLHTGEAKPYQAFKDTNSPTVYKNIHALFWEMAVLRDVLSEFIAVFCLGRNDATTLSGLLKSLNKNSSSDSFAEEVRRIADRQSSQGWLARFGSYRDCFTHSAPLNLVGGSALAVQDQLILKNASPIPQIYYPLPEDPDGLMRDRARGVPFDPANKTNVVHPRKRDRAKEPDALEYLHGRLCELTDLATRLILRSPIAPEPMVFGKDDIIGEVRISQGS
jgi:hypothetical protein